MDSVITSLKGVGTKIERAKKHFSDLHRAVTVFEASQPWGFSIEKDMGSGYEVYRFHQKIAIPDDWGAIVGDCIHNTRSALDHLAHALVISNGNRPGDYTAFPIGSDASNFSNSAINRINGASKSARELIRRLKPYNGGNRTLYSLHRLNILDKHQMITPIAAAHRTFGFKFDITMPGMEHLPPPQRFFGPAADKKFPLKDGDEILAYRRAPADMDDKTEFDFTFFIAIKGGEFMTANQ